MTEVYSAGLMSQSFWFLEFKKIVKLSHKGMSAETIREKCIEDNLFGAVNENRERRMAGYLVNRVATMQDKEKEIFVETGVETQKLINLVTILRLDRLFFEFLYEVYREKNLLGTGEITDADVNIFMNRKEAQSELVAGWKETTRRKLKGCYTGFMTEANLLRIEASGKDKRRLITPPMMDVVLERWLGANGEEAIARAITGAS